MKARILLLVLGSVLCVPSSLGRTFACRAQAFQLESFEMEPGVASPDHWKRVQLRKNYTFEVWNRSRQVATFEYRDMNCCVEVGWSPDSTQFFVMYSDSGGNGSFTVHWYTLSDNFVSENHATRAVADDFGLKYSCREGGPNNLFLLGWTRDAKKVLLVTEVAGRDCGKQLDRYQGYLVDAKDGRVVRRFGEGQTDRIEKSCRAIGAIPTSALR